MSENHDHGDGLDLFKQLERDTEHSNGARNTSTQDDERRYRRRGLLRWVATGIGLVVVVGLFVGGWYTARVFESPAQKEASAKAPKPGPVTAEVVRGTLGQTFTARMSIAPTTSLNAVIPAPGSPAYITTIVAGPGTMINSGSLIATVNSGPVFALPGAFPFYRDMTQGDTGLDITQLQHGLQDAGYSVTADGKYGPTTTAAVTKLFTRAGFTPPTIPNTNVEVSGGSPTGAANTSTVEPANPTTAPATSPTVGNSDTTGSVASQSSAPPPPATTPSTNASTTTPAQAATLSTFPLSNIMVFTGLPARVATAPAVGSPVGADTKLGIQLGPLQGSGPVAPSVAVNLKTGMPGTLQVGSETIPVTVQNISPLDQNAGNMTVTVAPTGGGPLPDAWNGQQGLATITITASDKDVLIVPSNSIATDGTGGGTVLKRQRNGTFIEVRVREVSSLGGRSSVEPVVEGGLRAGDLVQVGS